MEGKEVAGEMCQGGGDRGRNFPVKTVLFFFIFRKKVKHFGKAYKASRKYRQSGKVVKGGDGKVDTDNESVPDGSYEVVTRSI